MKHTLGPWFVCDLETGEIKDGELGIASGKDPSEGPWIATTEPMTNYEECQANARLIAAAPDLLEACRLARNLYDHLALGPLGAAAKYGPDYMPPTDEDCLEVRSLLEGAIAKAEAK